MSREWCLVVRNLPTITRDESIRVGDRLDDLDIERERDDRASIFYFDSHGDVELARKTIRRQLARYGLLDCIEAMIVFRWDEHQALYVDPSAPPATLPRAEADEIGWTIAVRPASIWVYQDVMAELEARGFTVVSADGHDIEVGATDA